MTAPFIFIGTHTIKEGVLEEFKAYSRDFVKFVEANEPRLIGFYAYVNDEGTQLTMVQVHPDAESMEFHMQTVSKHIGESFARFLGKTERIDVYGTPSDGVVQMIKQLAGAGVPLTVNADYLGGFARFPPI